MTEVRHGSDDWRIGPKGGGCGIDAALLRKGRPAPAHRPGIEAAAIRSKDTRPDSDHSTGARRRFLCGRGAQISEWVSRRDHTGYSMARDGSKEDRGTR